MVVWKEGRTDSIELQLAGSRYISIEDDGDAWTICQ